MVAGEDPADPNHKVRTGENEAERLPGAGPGAQCNPKQHESQDDMRYVMRQRMMMVGVAAGKVEKGQHAENDVKNAGSDQYGLARFPPPHCAIYCRTKAFTAGEKTGALGRVGSRLLGKFRLPCLTT